MINVLVVHGRLTRDPELKASVAGLMILKFSVAHNEYRHNDDGSWKEITSYFDVVEFAQRAEKDSQILKKGMAVIVWGKIQQERWQDKESGQTRSRVSIIANKVIPMGEKAKILGPEDVAETMPAEVREQVEQVQKTFVDDFEDDIPF